MSATATPNDYMTRDMLKEDLNDFGLKLFAYFDKRFDALDKRIDGIDDKYERLMTVLDAFLKRLDDIEADNAARDHEIERIKRWVQQIAQKTGVKLEY